MNKPVGGRGKRADYVSTHVRIPEDVKPYVDLIKDWYFDGQLPDLDNFKPSAYPTLDQAREYADKLVSQKKSARISLNKLIEFIYGCHR